MKRHFRKRTLMLDEINYRIQSDASAFVQEECERYEREIEALARQLTMVFQHHGLVMLSGPSSSGKTTTAHKLRDWLREFGIEAYSISMDDFYRGRELAPRLPDGSFDYEALEALRLDELERCMRDLLEQGETLLPQFDFTVGRPSPEQTPLRIGKNSVVIFEGIHAINPYFEDHLPLGSMVKVFINTITPFYEGDQKLMARRDIRLVRRMLRDERFRSSPVESTLNMWPQVVRGENTYMFPYVDTVDYMIDTTHAFEPCLFAPQLLPLVREVSPDHPLSPTAKHIANVLQKFEDMPVSLLPEDSMLREFVGKSSK